MKIFNVIETCTYWDHEPMCSVSVVSCDSMQAAEHMRLQMIRDIVEYYYDGSDEEMCNIEKEIENAQEEHYFRYGDEHMKWEIQESEITSYLEM